MERLASRPGHLFTAPRLTFQTKTLLHIMYVANRNTIPRLFSLYFNYLSREFPRTVSLVEYHRRLESTYFVSTLLADSHLMVRHAISTGQHLPMCQFSTVLPQTLVLALRNGVSHQNLHRHTLCGHQTI